VGRGLYHRRVLSQLFRLTLSSLYFPELNGHCFRPSASLGGTWHLPPPRLESTASTDSFFPPLFPCFWLATASGQSLLRAGRGFYHRRVVSQPLRKTLSSPLFTPLWLLSASRFVERDAASTIAGL
jgi:hypothetical protein